MKKDTRISGFTLIEVLLVIAILAILAAVVIIALNPAKQLAEAQNAQRRSDVRAILDAVHQYAVDNYGSLPAEIGGGTTCINDGAPICVAYFNCTGGVNLDALIDEEKYLTTIPTDPTAATNEISGYQIFTTSGGRVGVCAPSAYGDSVISITQ